MADPVTNIEENIATVLIGFSVYEAVYTKANFAALNAVDGELTLARCVLVIVLTIFCIASVRLTELEFRKNEGRSIESEARIDKLPVSFLHSGWLLGMLTSTVIVAAVALAFNFLNGRVAFTLMLGLMIYHIPIYFYFWTRRGK